MEPGVGWGLWCAEHLWLILLGPPLSSTLLIAEILKAGTVSVTCQMSHNLWGTNELFILIMVVHQSFQTQGWPDGNPRLKGGMHEVWMVSNRELWSPLTPGVQWGEVGPTLPCIVGLGISLRIPHVFHILQAFVLDLRNGKCTALGTSSGDEHKHGYLFRLQLAIKFAFRHHNGISNMQLKGTQGIRGKVSCFSCQSVF